MSADIILGYAVTLALATLCLAFFVTIYRIIKGPTLPDRILGLDMLVAIAIGFIAVMVFMLAAYSVFGVFSNLALMLNVMLILGALSGLQATLTLPGIAGIILTIGMAVDANVLIYERIREEAKTGDRPRMRSRRAIPKRFPPFWMPISPR